MLKKRNKEDPVEKVSLQGPHSRGRDSAAQRAGGELVLPGTFTKPPVFKPNTTRYNCGTH